jgi:flagellar hook-associated protein 1 FlgK
MGLSAALGTSVSGMRTTQAGLSIVAANVANASTPGYVRKSVNQISTAGSDIGIGVRAIGVNRELDSYLQTQLRNESTGGSYADLKSQFYQRLQGIYGEPGSASSLETLYNNFTSAVQALSANPSDYSARAGVLGTAQVLTQQINSTSDQIQGLRADAELGISDAVRTANEALQHISDINHQLAGTNANDASTASLLDQRDQYVDTLSNLMDIRVTNTSDREISVFTGSGLQLVGSTAAKLTFNAQGTISADAQWSADPSKSKVGTISLVINNGTGTDLISNNAIRSGKIASYLEMRDKILPQAQSQLDEFAAALSRSLSDVTTNAATVSSPPQAGFSVDTAGLLAGNKISLTYTDTATNVQRTVSFVRVDDPKALPLSDTFTADPNDKVYGIDFSHGLAPAINQMNALFGGRIQFSNPGGTTLQILDDGGANTVNLDAASITTTATSLSGNTPQLPFFTDGTQPFSGAISGTGAQVTGFAGRIQLNPNLAADQTKLIAITGNTAAGDATRPVFLYNQLTAAAQTYSPKSGFGSAASPFGSSIPVFLQQIMSQQGDAAAAAKGLSDGQALVVNALQQRFDDTSGVNIDQEMSNLVTLQTAYAANARVLTTIKDTLDTLLRI